MADHQQRVLDAILPTGTGGMTKVALQNHFGVTITSNDLDQTLRELVQTNALMEHTNKDYVAQYRNLRKACYARERMLRNLTANKLAGMTAANLEESSTRGNTPPISNGEFRSYVHTLCHEGSVFQEGSRYFSAVDPRKTDSTRKRILMVLRTKGQKGATLNDIKQTLGDLLPSAVQSVVHAMVDEGSIFHRDGRYVAAVDPLWSDSMRTKILSKLRDEGNEGAPLEKIAKYSRDLSKATIESIVDAMVEETSIFLRPDGRYVAGVDPDTVRGGAYYDDPADSFPVHFQTADTRPEVMRSLSAISDVPTSFNVEAKGKLSTAVQNASMPLTVTVSDKPTSPNVSEGVCKPWSEVLQKTQAEMCLTIEAQSVTTKQLLPLVELDAKTHRLTIDVWGNASLKTVASLVKQPMCVRDFTLRLAGSVTSLSENAFCELLGALCKIPDSSQLSRFTIPAALRKVVQGDPLDLAESLSELKSNRRASAVVMWKSGGAAPGSPATPSPRNKRDTVQLWLTSDAQSEFDPQRAVAFPRDRLLQASPVVRGMLEDSPEESRVPLPMDSLQVRSVSLDALRVTAALVRATASTVNDDDDDGDDAELPNKRKRKEAKPKGKKTTRGGKAAGSIKKDDSPPAWTTEFQAVFELDVLPLVAGSGELPYRRQQLLKLFGEVLEIGRFLELRAAYEFGLVGGTGVVGRAISCE